MVTMKMKVKINGEFVGVCGKDDLVMLGASIHVFDRNSSEENNVFEASFSGILQKETEDEKKHIAWFNDRKISAGDIVEIQFVESTEKEINNEEINTDVVISEIDYP